MLRNHQARLPICQSYHFTPPPEIAAAAQDVISAFSHAGTLANVAGDDDASDANLLDVQDDSFPEDEFFIPCGEEEQAASHLDWKKPVHVPAIQKPLRALIRALYAQLPPPGSQSNVFHSAIIKFLVMASRDFKGDWKNSSGITQMIAALTFGGRLSAFDMMCQGIVADKDSNYNR